MYWFRNISDTLDETGKETLTIAGLICDKYGFDFEDFVYDKEIEKIPKGEEREWFQVNFLDDYVLAAEIRILVWLYCRYVRPLLAQNGRPL